MPVEAVRQTLPQLRGAFAIAIMFKGEDDLLIAARNGPPLAVGYGEGEMYLGSDAIALAPFTDNLSYLEDGDWAVLTRSGVVIYDETGATVDRPVQKSAGTAFLVSKGNHRHFMEKEIHEQPEVISHTLANYLDFSKGTVRRWQLHPSISPRSTALRLRPVARPIMPGWSANTGSNALPGCLSISMWRLNSDIAKCRFPRTALRCSSRSLARRPIRWRPCAIANSRA